MPDTPVVAPPSKSPQQDPTALTTEKVQREIEQAVELLRTELHGEIKNLVTRFDGADTALELLQAKADKSPTIGELVERFEGLRALLAEIDKRYLAEFVKLSTTTEMMVKQQELALSATKEAVALAMNASEAAVAKAEAAAEKRFASINEFRQQLADQQATFARSDLVSQRADSLENKMDDVARGLEARLSDNKDYVHRVEASIAAMENRGKGASLLWGVLAGVAGLLIGFVMLGLALLR